MHEGSKEKDQKKTKKKEERKKPPYTDNIHIITAQPHLLISEVHCSVVFGIIFLFTLSDWDKEMEYRNLRDKMIERDESQIKREMRKAMEGGD